MTRTWKYDIDQMIYVAGNDWLEYGRFGDDTYGLHTTLDGKEAIIRIDATTSKDAIDDANKTLDMIESGWRAVNWECSITEAAEILGISRQAVHSLIMRGKLDARKVGNAWTISRDSVAARLSNR